MVRIYAVMAVLLGITSTSSAADRLESRWLSVEIDRASGAWALTDARSGVRWPSEGAGILRRDTQTPRDIDRCRDTQTPRNIDSESGEW